MKILNSNQLKLIAVITMLIDHIGMVLFPHVMMLRMIGRLAFPIYCYMLTEGVRHTKNINSYIVRLLIFALISEVFFDLAHAGMLWDVGHQNVYFTLAFSLIALYFLETDHSNVTRLIVIFLCMGAADLLKTDYGSGGVATVLIFYFCNENYLLLSALLFGSHYFIYGLIQGPAVLSVIPIAMYNHERGRKIKYPFYAFYPCHLFILFLIRRFL